ncbi:MAG: hypothetical protein CVU78_04620 [Elusimicrobia bacterium HGW-Elusimicrobia-2]|nr:MAG: hypothetical protein CVU78_04620 [Elusimicrobia bacterium HGW-Elusimicrobia-2]
MKKTMGLSILFFISTLTMAAYCQELTHKIYWLTDKKDYSPVTSMDVEILYSEDDYQQRGIMLRSILFDHNQFELVEDVKIASVEIEAVYPGISDIEVFEAEIRKITGSMGGNLAVILSGREYANSKKISGLAARIYRFQFKKDGQALSGKSLRYLRLCKDSEFLKNEFINRIKRYEKHGDERKGDEILSETAFAEIYRKMMRNVMKTLKLEDKFEEEDEIGLPKGCLNFSEPEIKLFFQKINENLLKLKEEYPQEYEEYVNIHKTYHNITFEERIKKGREYWVSEIKKKTSKTVNKNQTSTK